MLATPSLRWTCCQYHHGEIRAPVTPRKMSSLLYDRWRMNQITKATIRATPTVRVRYAAAATVANAIVPAVPRTPWKATAPTVSAKKSVSLTGNLVSENTSGQAPIKRTYVTASIRDGVVLRRRNV